jgi:glycosyltransferase involved in cell wall biosynthesis
VTGQLGTAQTGLTRRAATRKEFVTGWLRPQTSSMSDGVVRWPDRPGRPGRVAVVTVSYNTRELTALMLWSLRRILEWESLEIVVVDNGSKDGSAELLAKIDAAGGCRLLPNAGNVMHGPALTQAMSFLASRGSELPQWVWVLDSDAVISRPDALKKAVDRGEATTDPSYEWARDHHDPHFGLVEGAAAQHDELMTAFRAEVGPLNDQQAVGALTIRA